MSHYPLTRSDFDAATRVMQRLIEFQDAQDQARGLSRSLNDRSAHLRESVKTLALACDFWAAPEPEQKQQQPATRQGSRRRRPRNRR